MTTSPAAQPARVPSALTSSPERLRLGIDLDGVITDFNGGWMERYDRDFGVRLDPSDVVGWDGLQALTRFGSMDEFWAWAQGDGRSVFLDLPPMPGALEALERLAAKHRIVILTARFDWAIADTLAWLADHRVTAREIHFVEDKARIPCDVYLDDAPDQIAAFLERASGATVCRAVRPWNRALPGAVDIPDWDAFERLVARLAGTP
jgi:5'(3')-deoxyribonucleotidase